MPLLVVPCTKDDMLRMAVVEKKAFGASALEPILFPGPFPENVMDNRAQELTDQMTNDPTSRWFKVVDTDLPTPDEGIAFAKWAYYVDTLPDFSYKKMLGQGCNIEACDLLYGGLAAMKEKQMKDKHCIYLHILITHPDHQRRGAAGLLLKQGIEDGKLHNVDLHLESSLRGHEFYKKYGFRDIDILELDLSKWGATEPHRNWAMVCEPGIAEA